MMPMNHDNEGHGKIPTFLISTVKWSPHPSSKILLVAIENHNESNV